MHNAAFGAKAAIFDFDGTLFNSSPYWEETMQGYLIRCGVQPTQDCMPTVKPLGVHRGAEVILRQYHLDIPPAEMVRDWRTTMGKHYRDTIPVREGVVEYLEMLRSQGIPTCIATAMERDFVESALHRTGVYPLLDLVVTIEDVKSDKNSPEIFLHCAHHFGATPGEAVVFEDSPAAAAICHDAGFSVVGVFDGMSEKDYEDIAEHSIYTIRSFYKLPAMTGKSFSN